MADAMQFTQFGLFFIPAAVLVAVLCRGWFPAVLVVAAVLQAVSVVNIPLGQGLYGVTPYSVAALVAACLLASSSIRQPRAAFERLRLGTPEYLFFGYAAVAVAGALSLPLFFEGAQVFYLGNRAGFNRETSALTITVSNFAQAANLIVHAVVLLYLLRNADTLRASGLMARALFATSIAMVALGAYERIAELAHLPSTITFWMNNPGYVQYYPKLMGGSAKVLGWLRVSVPFSESSYASAFQAAAFVGTVAVALFGRRVRWAVFGSVVIGFGLLNTLGTTGIVSAAVGAGATLLLRVSLHWRERKVHQAARVRPPWLKVAALCLAAGLIAVSALPYIDQVAPVVDKLLLSKSESGSAQVRERSNWHALRLVVETAGLGVGMGSNRASSYLASLLSNTGVVGTILYLGMLHALVAAYLRAPALSDWQIFVIGALFGATFGVFVAIPDLNLPAYWIFLFAAFVYRPHGDPTDALVLGRSQ